MKAWEQRWFGDVYFVINELDMPFGFFTSYVEMSDLKRSFPKWEERELAFLEKVIKKYQKKKPSEKAFLEEKEKIIPSLKNDLQERLPFVETAVQFGSTIGDIDIGLIALKGKEEVYNLATDPKIRKQYPLVDWNSLIYFRSIYGFGITSKMADSRTIVTGRKKLSIVEKKYITDTVNNSQLLWGDPECLNSMRMGLHFI